MEKLRLKEKLVEAFKIELDRCYIDQLYPEIYPDYEIKLQVIEEHKESFEYVLDHDSISYGILKTRHINSTLKCELSSVELEELKDLARDKYDELNKDLMTDIKFKIDTVIGANDHIRIKNEAIEE